MKSNADGFTQFSLSDISKIGKNWRRLPAIQEEARNLCNQKGLEGDDREEFLFNYEEEKVPGFGIKLFEKISAYQESNIIEMSGGKIISLFGINDWKGAAEIGVEMLNDCDLLEITVSFTNDSACFVIKDSSESL